MALSFSHSFTCTPDHQAVDAARSSVDAAREAGKLGFALLPYQSQEELAGIEELAAKLNGWFTTFIIIGIGGSDLGTRAIHRALNHQFYNQLTTPRLFFVGDTTDPVPLQEVIDLVTWEETAVIIVSKSGNTVEQQASFLVLRDHLKKAVGDRFAEHIVAITDPESGTLRELAVAEGYETLAIPSILGGRFSVLSPVGLLPLALVGVDIHALLAGGRMALEQYAEDALWYAAHQHTAYTEGRTIHVFMPYTYSLREVGFWFRQLWAESLGKAQSLSGEAVHVGPTPVAAIGPTDQHSQVQLYREGPDDKTFTFIAVTKPGLELCVPKEVPASLKNLAGRSFNEILQAELQGTRASLQEVGRPTYTVTLDRVDAEHIGALLVFFELATAYAGSLFNVNPYDQPGVERGKELMREFLAGASV